jgi:hypothetical protein
MKFDIINISNYSLILLGQSGFITSLEGNTLKPYELIISKVYKNTFDSCLSEIMPNFAIKQISTKADLNNNYLIPSDCIKIISINNSISLESNYKIKGKYIYPRYSMKDGVIDIEYITNDYDYLENADNDFCKYCSYCLAIEICQSLTGNLQLKGQLQNDMEILKINLLAKENINNETIIYK